MMTDPAGGIIDALRVVLSGPVTPPSVPAGPGPVW
jgi:hypothetical protein